MAEVRVTKLTDDDIGKTFISRERKILIIDSFQSLFIGEDKASNEEFTFYNTGECTGIGCGWLTKEGE